MSKDKESKKKSPMRKGVGAFTKYATLGTVAGAGIGTYGTVKSIADEAAENARGTQTSIVIPEALASETEDVASDRARAREEVEATKNAVAQGATKGAKVGFQVGSLVGLGAAGFATRRRREEQTDEPESKAARYGNAAARYGFKHPVIAGLAGAGAIGTVLGADAINDIGDRREAMAEVANLPEEERELASRHVREDHPIGPDIQTAVTAAGAGLATRYGVWIPLTLAAGVGDWRRHKRRKEEEAEAKEAKSNAPQPDTWAERTSKDASRGNAKSL